MRLIMIFILVAFLLTACDPMNIPDKPHSSGLGPCERFEKAYPKCECDYSEGEAVLFRSDVKIENEYDAEKVISHYYFDNVALPNNLSAKEFDCEKRGEFFDCYTDGEYYATCNYGDIFKVVCEE